MQNDDYREDLPVSRGQWQRIAHEALRVLGEPVPATRWDATVMLVRLRETETADPAARAVATADF